MTSWDAPWAELERQILAPWASFSKDCRGRKQPEEEDALRTPWQRDRDRIIHSKAFRRLMHKAQVFINPHSDHFRTRLTHTLEVTQIARTISRALHLNEDLTEAIALGHDLGHTPFGHAGERALASLRPGFSHNRQGLRVVEVLERDGAGLNLTLEVRDGILHHSGEGLPLTPEGRVVRVCDRIAYLNHDIDDALRSGLLQQEQLPAGLLDRLGHRHSQRINNMVRDLVQASADPGGEIRQSPAGAAAMDELRAFMFERVYYHPLKLAEEQRLAAMLARMYEYYLAHPETMPPEFRRDPLDLAVCDYIAGMTDHYALDAGAAIDSDVRG